METIFSTLFAVLGICALVSAGVLLVILVASFIKFLIKDFWGEI